MRLGELLRETRGRLKRASVDSPDLDARLLVEHFTGASARDLVSRPETEIAPEAAAALDAGVERRLAGEPVHRILGWREFHGMRLALSPATLEPRDDTETLVDAVLRHLQAVDAPHILDLGTGTGAIALALLKEIPAARAIGADVSKEALETAWANAEALGLDGRFETVRSDWFEKISGRFDAIVSNPPYIRTEVISQLAREVREHDAMAALDGGSDGLDAYRSIAKSAERHLLEQGIVAVEIGYDQREDVLAIFTESGYAAVDIDQDLGGNDRTIVFRLAK